MAEHRRLDPETILRRMRQEEAEEKDESGILKIYLGYSAGVGKTYRMLQNAQSMKKNKVDVVVGVVETHGRAETEALLEGLEVIPRKKVEYQGITIEEFDIDAVLKRRPALVLVDELAHTNAPNSRNAKRYQDIEELIKSGINVATALNIQHLSSVSDIVEQMTGVNVREAVPDSFFEEADEIELVDIPIEELEKRLREGKVYIPEKARVAMMEFFKKTNLMGLRELSLRHTARQVGEEILDYMRENAIRSPIPVGSRILVSIGPSPTSQKLIRSGHRMAEDLNADWFTIYVESIQFGVLSDGQKQQIDKNMKLAEDLGARVVTLAANRIADAVAEFAMENHITLILAGFSSRSWLDNLMRGSVVDELIRKAKPIQILLVDTGQESGIKKKFNPGRFFREGYRYLLSTVLVVLFTGVSFLLFPHFGFTNIAMIMLLPILITSTSWGKRSGILASFLSVAALDFFFVPPYYTFTFSDIHYLPIFAVFFIVGVTTSVLSDLVRWRVDTYRRQEKFLYTIYNFSKELLKLNYLNEIQDSIVKNIASFFGSETVLLLPNKEDIVKTAAKSAKDLPFGENEVGIAQWVYKNGKTAGRETETLSSSRWFFLPMTSNETVIGVITIDKKAGESKFSPEENRYLDSFASIAAMAVSRALSMSNYLNYILKSL